MWPLGGSRNSKRKSCGFLGLSGARFHRIANVTPRTRASRGTAIEATVNAEHLLRGGVRRCLRTNAPLGETRGFRLCA